MATLKEAKIGSTVTVKKLNGTGKEKDHGYGHHKGC